MQVCTSPRQIGLTMPAPCDRIIITPFSVVSDLTAKFQVVPFRARFYVPFRHTATRPTRGFVVVDRDGQRPSGAGPGGRGAGDSGIGGDGRRDGCLLLDHSVARPCHQDSSECTHTQWRVQGAVGSRGLQTRSIKNCLTLLTSISCR